MGALKAIPPESIWPLKRAQYDRMIAEGVFGEDEKVELLYGQLVAMSPEGAAHGDVIAELLELLFAALGKRARIRPQMSLALSDVSEPEPDIAVCARERHFDRKPSTALLVIEVAHSSVRFDRTVKTAVYAQANIPEYWIVNIAKGEVEVYRDPVGETYQAVTKHGAGASLTLLAFPDVALAVDDFFPPK